MSTEVTTTVPLEKDESHGEYFTYTGDRTQYQIHLKLPNYKSDASEGAFLFEITPTPEEISPIHIIKHLFAKNLKEEEGEALKPITITINDPTKSLLLKEADIELFFSDTIQNPEVKGTTTVAFKKAKKRDRLDNEDLPSDNE